MILIYKEYAGNVKPDFSFFFPWCEGRVGFHSLKRQFFAFY